MLISFIIPCYRSENTIEKVVDEIKQTIETDEKFDYEIIAVNDGSPDDVYSVLSKIAKTDKKIKVLDLMKNSGKDSAIMAGLSYANGDIAVLSDDDFQCPITNVFDLIAPIVTGKADVSTAEYEIKKESTFKRLCSNLNMYSAQMMLGQPKGFRFENFTAIARVVYLEMLNYKNPYPFTDGLILRVTKRVVSVRMEERERADDNSSGFTFRKSFRMFFDGLTAFSVKPLRVASFTGFITAMFGMLYLIYTVVMYFVSEEHILEGYSSIMSIILLIGGILMMMIGMVGEYVGRIYMCINQSPQYVIRESINIE